MENLKVYIVTDKTAFKEYCKEKLNTDLSVIFDKNNEIHLVPKNVPNEITNRYIGYSLQKYSIYIKDNEKWQNATFIDLDEDDILSLIEMNYIEDYEEYKQWIDATLYLIKDKERFIESFDKKLSDFEKIIILNNILKFGEQNIYLIERDNGYDLLAKMEHSYIAHSFTKTALSYADISKLNYNNLVIPIKCKIHKKYNNIRIEDSKHYILVTDKHPYQFPKVYFENDKYIARTTINESLYGYGIERIMAKGNTKDEALRNLRIKMQAKLEKYKEDKAKSLNDSIEDDFADI